MPDLSARLTRIDAAIACRRAARDIAEDACHHEQAREHGAEVDRLKALRGRVARGHAPVAV